MNHAEIIKSIMERKNLKQGDIGKHFDAKYVWTFFRKVNRKNTTFIFLVEILNLLGYEVVFQPKGGKLPEHSYRMTWEDYKDLPDGVIK